MIVVTGATGQLGRLVIEELLQATDSKDIIAAARRPKELSDLAARGIQVREADYSRPQTLRSAFAGADRLLLISSSENGKRKEQHRNVIKAAKDVGVGLIAYTSILHADRSPLFLAEEHRDTEAALVEAGVPFALLRNGWYTEVYTWRLPLALKDGVLLGAARDGRISSAARADYAKAAAIVLLSDSPGGRTYELAGDTAFTLAQLVDVVNQASDKPISYKNMAPEEFRLAMLQAGLPEIVCRILSDTDAGVSHGALYENSGQLGRLIRRPTTAFQTTIARFVHTRMPTGESLHHA